MDCLSSNDGFIKALAIYQYGSMNRMLNNFDIDATHEEKKILKVLVSEELTSYASSILLDPVYSYLESEDRHKEADLLLIYEQTGYDNSESGRQPRLIEDLSVKRLSKDGVDGVKILLYYDADESGAVNEKKKIFVEGVGNEYGGEGLPFYLEILTYHSKIADTNSQEFSKVKLDKVNSAMKGFSKSQYKVDVLKVETLKCTNEVGSEFNGVLCGREAWRGVVEPFTTKSEKAVREWLQTTGKKYNLIKSSDCENCDILASNS